MISNQPKQYFDSMGAPEPMRRSLSILTLVSLLWLPSAALGSGTLDVKGWLDRDRVQLVVVDFYATWCKPCMKAMPRWKALKDKYYNKGLRIILVNTQDADAASAMDQVSFADHWVSDPKGMIAQAFGVGNSLPSAFLWSWQGQLLTRGGHIDEVEKAIEAHFAKAPRLGLAAELARNMGLAMALRGALSHKGKLTIVATEEERAALKAARKKQQAVTYDSKLSCELGKAVPPNALLQAQVGGSSGNQTLNLSVLDIESGCVSQTATATMTGDTNAAAIDAVEGLLSAYKQPQVQMPNMATKQAIFGETNVVPSSNAWSAGDGKLHVVKFSSSPPGATVLVDGEAKCSTPCKKGVSGGSHTVVMTQAGYITRSETVNISKDNKVLSWTLKKDEATLRIESAVSGLPIYIDDDDQGVTPSTIKVTPGPHRVVVGEPRCHEPHTMEVKIDRGETRTLEFKPVIRMAGLRVTATDEKGNDLEATIYANGKKVGETMENITLPLCSSDLEVRHSIGNRSLSVSLKEKSVVEESVKIQVGFIQRTNSLFVWGHNYIGQGALSFLLGFGPGTKAEAYQLPTTAGTVGWVAIDLIHFMLNLPLGEDTRLLLSGGYGMGPGTSEISRSADTVLGWTGMAGLRMRLGKTRFASRNPLEVRFEYTGVRTNRIQESLDAENLGPDDLGNTFIAGYLNKFSGVFTWHLAVARYFSVGPSIRWSYLSGLLRQRTVVMRGSVLANGLGIEAEDHKPDDVMGFAGLQFRLAGGTVATSKKHRKSSSTWWRAEFTGFFEAMIQPEFDPGHFVAGIRLAAQVAGGEDSSSIPRSSKRSSSDGSACDGALKLMHARSYGRNRRALAQGKVLVAKCKNGLAHVRSNPFASAADKARAKRTIKKLKSLGW